MTLWQVTRREEGLPEHIKVSLIKRDGESKKTVQYVLDWVRRRLYDNLTWKMPSLAWD